MPNRYRFRPHEVEALMVTEDNLYQISKWIKPRVEMRVYGPSRISVESPNYENDNTGQWLVRDGSEVLTLESDNDFEKLFEPVGEPGMNKYRLRPATFEAMQIIAREFASISQWSKCYIEAGHGCCHIYIDGTPRQANYGDWLVRDPSGGFRLVLDKEFERDFEPVIEAEQ